MSVTKDNGKHIHKGCEHDCESGNTSRVRGGGAGKASNQIFFVSHTSILAGNVFRPAAGISLGAPTLKRRGHAYNFRAGHGPDFFGSRPRLQLTAEETRDRTTLSCCVQARVVVFVCRSDAFFRKPK